MVDTGNAPPAAPPPSSANVAVDDHATNTVIPAGAHDDAQRVRFASLWFPIFLPAVTEAILSKTLYIDFFGANAEAIGVFSMIYAVVGSCASLYVGLVMDNLSFFPSMFPPKQWGRRAPWLMFLIPLYCITTSLVYNPTMVAGIEQQKPGTATCDDTLVANASACGVLADATRQGRDTGMKVGGLEIYFFVTFCLHMIAQSALFATYFGVIPEMYPNPLDRGRAGVFVGIFNALSGITVVVVVQFVFVKSSVNLTGVVLLNVLPMLLLSWPGIKETRAIKFIQSHKKIECKEVLAFMTQRSSFTYVMSTFFHFIANTLNILFLVFWLTRVTGVCIEEAARLLGAAGVAQLFCGIVGLPFFRWILVTKKIHPRKIVCLGYALLGVAGFIGVQTKTKMVVVPLGALRGLVFSVNSLSNRMFVGWLTDEDMVRRYNVDGKVVRREAFIQGIVGWSVTGAYLVGGLMTLILGATGYNGTLPTRCIPSASVDFIHFAFGTLPAIVCIGRAVALWFWPLYGKKLREMEESTLKIKEFTGAEVIQTEVI